MRSSHANTSCLMMAAFEVLSESRAVRSSPGVVRLIDQSDDAAKGSEIEARGAYHSARSAGKKKKKNRLRFRLSGWALVALSYF